MNHIYRVIFNHSLNCYQAAPEISKGAHKSSGSAGSVVGSLPRLSRLSLLVSLAAAGSAYAAPTGGEVSVGQAVWRRAQLISLHGGGFGIATYYKGFNLQSKVAWRGSKDRFSDDRSPQWWLNFGYSFER